LQWNTCDDPSEKIGIDPRLSRMVCKGAIHQERRLSDSCHNLFMYHSMVQ
jgi:hypothetical protein